jgi:predicted regulator of Ras-like GTPase activity (Roadblock/LC7/MglB family)
MSFRAHLESLVTKVDGALAASIMGFDGIPVETHPPEAPPDLELSTAWVEYGNLLSQLKSAAEVLKTGPVQEVSINTEKVLTVMRLLTPEYFLVLALKPEGNYGKARYALRIAAPMVKTEL